MQPANQEGYGAAPAGDAYSNKSKRGQAEPQDGKLLAAAGVLNEKGEVAWPLGLKILPNREAQELCRQVDGMVRVLAQQAEQGKINPRLPGEIKDAVGRLEQLLQNDRAERTSLTSGMYADAERFLTKLFNAARVMLALQPRDDGSSNPYTPSATAQTRKTSGY
jgi:hypothetical protein